MFKIFKIFFLLTSCSSCALLLLIDEESDHKKLSSTDNKSCIFTNKIETKPLRNSNYDNKKKITTLYKNLHSNNISIRTNAVTDIGYLKINSKNLISKIEEMALKDESKWVRRAAVKSLANLRSYGSIEILQKAEKDPDPYVRSSAKNSLIKLTKRARLTAVHN